MKLTEFFVSQLDREVERSRRALAEVPEGKYDWKPHEKSMIFGYLANMVATIPTWLVMMVAQDELDVAPAASTMKQDRTETSAALVGALDKSNLLGGPLPCRGESRNWTNPESQIRNPKS